MKNKIIMLIMLACFAAATLHAQMTGGRSDNVADQGPVESNTGEYRNRGFIFKAAFLAPMGKFAKDFNPDYSLPENLRHFGHGGGKGTGITLGGFSYFKGLDIPKSMLGLSFGYDCNFIFGRDDQGTLNFHQSNVFSLGPLFTFRATNNLYLNLSYNIGLLNQFTSISTAAFLNEYNSAPYTNADYHSYFEEYIDIIGLGFQNKIDFNLQVKTFTLGFEFNFNKIRALGGADYNSAGQSYDYYSSNYIYTNDYPDHMPPDVDPKLTMNQTVFRVYVGTKSFKRK
jgi:hypothetical protein